MIAKHTLELLKRLEVEFKNKTDVLLTSREVGLVLGIVRLGVMTTEENDAVAAMRKTAKAKGLKKEDAVACGRSAGRHVRNGVKRRD